MVRAYHDKLRQAQHVQRLFLVIDDLKVLVQLGKELCVYYRFDEFETPPAGGQRWPLERWLAPGPSGADRAG